MSKKKGKKHERAAERIKPMSSAWKSTVLPITPLELLGGECKVMKNHNFIIQSVNISPFTKCGGIVWITAVCSDMTFLNSHGFFGKKTLKLAEQSLSSCSS